MRLHPAVTREEAADWLTRQVAAEYGADRLPEFRDTIERLAEAMAAISAVELPDEVEPLFP
jgi:hypothetical protein